MCDVGAGCVSLLWTCSQIVQYDFKTKLLIIAGNTSEPSFLKIHLAYFSPNCCYFLGNTLEFVYF